jgi:hypothetical protein
MKPMTDIFVTIAEDCVTSIGRIPALNTEQPSIARLQHDLLTAHPYEYDHDSFNFEIYCRRNQIADSDRNRHRDSFFSRSHPCLRASPLTKTYGFGAHYNSTGKIALYPADSVAYAKFLRDPSVKKEKAMRNRKAERSAIMSDDDHDSVQVRTHAVGHS